MIKRIFNPAIRILNRLSYRQKFSLIAALILLPMALTMFFLMQALNNDINVARHQQDGLKYNRALKNFVMEVPKHGVIAQNYLTGNKGLANDLDQETDKINLAVKEIDRLDNLYGKDLATSSQWQDVKKQWEDLASNVKNLTPAESYKMHSQLAAETIKLGVKVGNNSELVLASKLDRYYLATQVVRELPSLIQKNSQLRNMGISLALKGSATTEEKIALISVYSDINSLLNLIENDMHYMYQENPKLKTSIEPAWNKCKPQIEQFLAVSRDVAFNPEAARGNLQSYYEQAAAVSSAASEMYNVETQAIEKEVNKYLTQLLVGRQFALLWFLLTLILLAYIFVGFWLSVYEAVNALHRAGDEMTGGDLTVRVDLHTRDELQVVGNTFNEIGERIGGMVAANKQAAEKVAELSAGLSESANQTSLATEQVAVTIGEVAAGATNQAQNANVILNMIANSQAQVKLGQSEAQSTFEQSRNSTLAADKGQKAVGDAVYRLTTMAEGAKETARAVENLGNRANEIGSIITTITEISDQINLLALNAAIEAARAGENGRGFSVVAEEVRKLAEETRLSAGQIAEVITATQAETKTAVQMTEASLSAVQEQVELLKRVGDSLSAIVHEVKATETNAEQMQVLFKEITAGTDQVSTSIQEISRVIEASAAASEQVAASAEEQTATMEEIAAMSSELAHLAEDLRIQTDKFKV